MWNESASLEPHSYEEAINHSLYGKEWRAAAQEEYNSLMKHSAWELTNLPPSKNLVTCKWVFRAKQHANSASSDSRPTWSPGVFPKHSKSTISIRLPLLQSSPPTSLFPLSLHWRSGRFRSWMSLLHICLRNWMKKSTRC
jgi:hypothetical protein